MVGAEALPIALIPEQPLIPTVGNDMVDDRGADDQPLTSALGTMRLEAEEAGARAIPGCAVPAITGRRAIICDPVRRALHWKLESQPE